MLRIRDVYLGSNFFHSGSRVDEILDPGSGSASKYLIIFIPKNWYKVLKNKIRDVHPGSQILALDFFLSRIRIQGVKGAPYPGSATLQWSNTNMKIVDTFFPPTLKLGCASGIRMEKFSVPYFRKTVTNPHNRFEFQTFIRVVSETGSRVKLVLI